MPSSCCLDWPFDVQTLYQMWKEWLTVLGQHMVSNELTGAHHSQFWHFRLSPSASGGWIHVLVCPQLCVFENWPSPSHLQQTEFSHASQTSLDGVCGHTCPSCLSTADCHPTPGLGFQGQWLSPLHSHPTHSPWGGRSRGIRLCLSRHSSSCYWAPCQTLGVPCHTQQCMSSSVASAANQLAGVNRWAELSSWKGLPLLAMGPCQTLLCMGANPVYPREQL